MKAKPTGTHKRAVVSAEDQALFAEAMTGVAPLHQRDRVAMPQVPRSPVREAALPPEQKLAVEGDGQRYAARSAGVSHTQVAELRAGRVRAEATVDLHGCTVDAAVAQLRQFAVESQRLGRRCILVVHGKGLHSEHGAPLREAVLAELLGPMSGLVHALSSAAQVDGGEGATYVLLRGSR